MSLREKPMEAHALGGLVIDAPPAVLATPTQQRFCVDGKQFARGGERFRVQGVTYGPFAPGPDGHPFPSPERVADDFARMGECGVNAVRTYHVPPEWFFHLADEAGVAVLVD